MTNDSNPIAIIGASYSGLVLSNALDKHDVPHVILEAMAPPSSSSFVVGNFYLPSYSMIVKELGLSNDCLPLKPEDCREKVDDPCHGVSREQVIQALLQKVQQFIQYYTFVTNITHRNGQLYCDTRTGTILGPFSYVICANGARSSFRLCNDERILLTGDARWVSDRFWDFGRERIKCGGNVALLDGLELGSWLCQSFEDDGNDCVIPRKFCSTRSYRDSCLRRIGFYVVVMSIILGQFYAKGFPFSFYFLDSI